MTERAFTDKVVVITGGAKGIRWIAGGFMAKEQRLALIDILPKQHNSGD